MAGIEDFGVFESNFLDSMLEVEMTEEDGEVRISHIDDSFPTNVRDLPPIPRFDLQSETLTYKNPYGNSILPLRQTSILKPNTQMPGSSFPIPVIQPPRMMQSSPMIVIHPNMLKSNNVPLQQSIPGNAAPGISGKRTPAPKSIMAKPTQANDMAYKLAHKFMVEVFKPDFVKKVYTQKEELPDVSVIGEEEEAFYRFAFQDVSKVQLCRLHCTICDKHIGCGKGIEKKISVHSMLKVLTCKVCSEFYGDGNFPCDDGDHCEIYCRWCGQGGALICCSFCPKVFCKRCVRRNYTQAYVRAVERSSDWACFVCAQKPLWPHRAVCRALMDYLKLKKTDIRMPAKDTSMCCKSQLAAGKKIVPEVDKNKVFPNGGQILQIKPKDNVNAPQFSGRNRAAANISKAANTNEPMIVKNFSTALKVNSQTKTPVAVMNKPNMMTIKPKPAATSTLTRATASKPITSACASKAINTVPAPKPTISACTLEAINSDPAPKSVISVNLPKAMNSVPTQKSVISVNLPKAMNSVPTQKSVISVNLPKAMNSVPTQKSVISVNPPKGINSVPAQRSISEVNIPSVINTPIYHGQTLITPPRNNSVPKNPSPAPQIVQNVIHNASEYEASIDITLPVSGDVNSGDIPVAVIPPSVRGLILRLNYADDRVQSVRIIRGEDPTGCADYLIPKFQNSNNMDFLSSNLEDTFKLARMLYVRVLKIKEKYDARTEATTDRVFRSSVNKLSFIYGKVRELMKELDDNLLSSYEIWKIGRELEKEISIIDLSDDDGNAPKNENSSNTGKSGISSQKKFPEIEIVNAGARTEHDNSPQRILRSSIKREAEERSFENYPPEHVDVNAYEGKKAKNADDKSNKKMKLSEDEEEVMQIAEKDPLAVSDTELESNNHARKGLEQSTNPLAK